MSYEAWIACATLGVAVVLFVSKWIPLAATAIGIPIVLAATNTLTPEQSLSGFGNRAVIALASILLLGAGLQESGVASLSARGLQRFGGRSPTRTIIVIMVATAVLSAFMSNTATVAIFLPAVSVLSRRSGIAPSRLLMPLAFSAILGGTLTLIGTTPNLILGNELRLRTGTGIGMFEFAAVGAPIVIVGILFMATLGWRMLPDTRARHNLGHAERQEELAKAYGLARNLFQVEIAPDAEIAGRTIQALSLRQAFGLDVVLVLRPARIGRRSLQPGPSLVLEPGDLLYLEGAAADAHRFAAAHGLQPRMAAVNDVERLLGRGVTLAEVTLSPRSTVIGKTLLELGFGSKFGLHAISLWRGKKVTTAGIGDEPLQLGDALLVAGAMAQVRALAQDPDYLVLGDGGGEEEDVSRAPLAILLLLLALLPPLFGWLPLALSGMASAVLMISTGCLSLDGAKRSVDFTILFLVIGTIPLGIALEQSGVAGEAAQALSSVHAHLGVAGVLASLFLASALLSTTSNNAAAAVILAPVAAEVARSMGFDCSRAFLAVAFGASCTFMLPFAHSCNLMVMGPAGYATRDFARVGGVVTALMVVTAIVLLA